MTGGSRIVAFGPGSDPSLPDGHTVDGEIAAPTPPEQQEWPLPQEDWLAEADHEPGRSRAWLAPALALLLAAGWTGFFIWAMRHRFRAGVTPSEGVSLISNWAVPVLLVAVVWLLAMRSSRREAARFADAAASLSAESRLLEERLVAVNRELSLAREFIAAQSRDLDSLGRVAVDRISEHAGRLQELIVDNSGQVDSIAAVSTTALDNMERLRGQLPVVASSARDVANNIGHAGRIAQGTLDELAAAFSRLAASGADSAGRVEDVKAQVDRSLELFQQRLEQLQAVVGARLEELEHRGEDLRARLSASESAAITSLRERAGALSGEVDSAREALDRNEAEALTSLRARLTALRDETASFGRSLREGEAASSQALDAARQRMESDIRAMLERLDKLDREALEAARARIATLSQEAGEFDNRLVERNRQFSAETEERMTEAAARHDAEVARLAQLFAGLDAELDSRRAAQARSQQDLCEAAEGIAARLEGLSERIAAIAAYGNQAEESLGTNLRLLTDRIAANREALAGAGTSVEHLTDRAVRLLELIQASTEQSRDQLPAALTAGESALLAWEDRLASLREQVEGAAARAEDLSASAAGAHSGLVETMAQITELQANLGSGIDAHGTALAGLRADLSALDSESRSLAADAQERLTAAVERLMAATRAAVATLADESHDAIHTLADRIGEQSAEAIDRAMRLRLAEAVGQLEQATSHAAGISREAAIQLRDQLAKVDELAGNLERRVARARERAEEDVDNDFSRRVALITESLNSYAIDIAKALSTEVTDTAWAAYLRGDRGVFTRRAVRLVEVSEAREIARIYEDDSEFRDHVSRYIHDFEAMLRQLLSTRDGHALGVTLLSSDMGKLYVVMAQAIERLRT